jgi:hypothetical protein
LVVGQDDGGRELDRGLDLMLQKEGAHRLFDAGGLERRGAHSG